MTQLMRRRGQQNAADGVNLLLGAMLAMLPWWDHLLSWTAVTNALACGAAVAALSGIRYFSGHTSRIVSAIVIVLGLWIAVSPWVLSFWRSPWSMWTHLVTGLCIAALATWSAVASSVPGHEDIT